MSKEKKDPVNKQKKGINAKLFTKTQPIRDAVSAIAFDEATTPEEMAYVQNELRRLSRLVKKARKNQTEEK